MAGWGLSDLKDGFNKAREEGGKALSTIGDKAREARDAATNLARDAALVVLPDKLDLKQSKVMTQLVEKGLDAMGYKIKMDGVAGKDVLDAVNDMRKKADLGKLASVSDFGKDDLKAIMSGLQKNGGAEAMNVFNSIKDSISATVTDFAASLPKPEVGATRRAPPSHETSGP